jgi:uncharacterized protein (TIGR02145 family)
MGRFLLFFILICLFQNHFNAQVKTQSSFIDRNKCVLDSLIMVNNTKTQQIEKLNNEIKKLQASVGTTKPTGAKDKTAELMDKIDKQLLEIKRQQTEIAALHQKIKQLENQLRGTANTKSQVNGNNVKSSTQAGPPPIHTVKIGTQMWMTTNLNVSKFRNGDPILEAQTEEEWERAGKKKIPAWCYYDNDSKLDKKSGKLYNWYAVNDPRGLAPEGYHIPTEEDWNHLIKQLGGEEVAAPKMRFGREWGDSITISHPKVSFAAIPTGWRKVADDGTGFTSEGAYWWSATPLSLKFAWTRYILFFSKEVKSYCYNKASGLAVRCLKD